MSVKEPSETERNAEESALHPLFGKTSSDVGDARPPSVSALSKLTLKQLADGAKSLGLTAVSKLRKEALVQAVLDAWHGKKRDEPASAGPEVSAPPDARTDDAAVADVPVDGGQTPPFSHKFEIGRTPPIESPEARRLAEERASAIPWGYGRDRISVMPVDPEKLYAYWEILDESIAAARPKLGAGGAGAWLNLRVYDVTGRIFDGTNAHGVVDHRIERGDRQWFFTIGRPTSEVIVELGLKSHEGYFVKIARSGRIEFPRREPAPWREPEWLTVRVATGQTEYAGPRWLGRAARPATAPSGVAGVPARTGNDAGQGGGGGVRQFFWQEAQQAEGPATIAERQEWELLQTNATSEEHHSFAWDGPMTFSTWEAGPFSYPVEIPEPITESFVGKTRVWRAGARTHVVYGPWQVVIRGLGAQKGREVLSRWEVYRTWAQEAGHRVEEIATTVVGVGASEKMRGSSERRWVGGSEVRLGGSSQVFFLKASELRLGGASERMYAGASQTMMRGASERLLRGASEHALRGSSERMLGGGSEHFLGASEGRLGAGGAGGASSASITSATPSAEARSAYPEPPVMEAIVAVDPTADEQPISRVGGV